MTRTRVQLWCVWCGPAFVVVFFGGALMAGVIPPPPASDTAEEVKTFWATNPDVKRTGLVLMMIAAGLTAPYSIAIAMQLKRMEGAFSPMTYLQIMGGTLGVFAILMPTMLFMGAAFRIERPAEVQQGIMDIAFVPFIINYPPAVIQLLSITIAVLAQPRGKEILPRWTGYYALWTAFLFLPGALLLFFKNDAWYWGGLLAFWVVATVFGGLFLVIFWMVRKAILAEAAEEAPVREEVAV